VQITGNLRISIISNVSCCVSKHSLFLGVLYFSFLSF